MQEKLWQFFKGFLGPVANNIEQGTHCNISMKTHPSSSISLAGRGFGRPSRDNLNNFSFFFDLERNFRNSAANDTSPSPNKIMTASPCTPCTTVDCSTSPIQTVPSLKSVGVKPDIEAHACFDCDSTLSPNMEPTTLGKVERTGCPRTPKPTVLRARNNRSYRGPYDAELTSKPTVLANWII